MQMERGSSLGAFLAGLGLGIAVGMLFAPKTGGETRQLLKSKASEGTDYLKQRGSELRGHAGELIDKGKEALNRQKATLADAMDAGKQAYRDTMGHQPPAPAPGSTT
jgi:gas vesicle protein